MTKKGTPDPFYTKMLRGMPARWGGQMPLLVVGASDNYRDLWEGTQSDSNPEYPLASVTNLAPGMALLCATRDGGLAERTGTSTGKSGPTIPDACTRAARKPAETTVYLPDLIV